MVHLYIYLYINSLVILGFFQTKNEESIGKSIFGNLNGECICKCWGFKP